MGFGTLFVGYFLLLNIAYFTYTDAIAAVIILLGLYKLRTVNKPFSAAMWVSLGFAVFGCAELVLEVCGTFAYIPHEEAVYSAIATVRYGVLLALSYLTLTGMGAVAREVGLGKISDKAMRLRYAAAFIYTLDIILEASALSRIIDVKILVTLSVAAILATLIVTAAVLVEIYRCYMRIYMPGDEDMSPKRSKFKFIQDFREHEEQKQREYAEYKLSVQKKKQEKRKKK